MGRSVTDNDASVISEISYLPDQTEIHVPYVGDDSCTIKRWKVIEPITDHDTGLNGYVLEDIETGEIVISFEGTEPREGPLQLIKDIEEDANGVVFGNEYYVQKEGKPVPYYQSGMQDALLATGRAKIVDGKFVPINKNQFTEADVYVQKYVEKYGAENITFVGHSLGGALAQFFAMKYDGHAITFAAPDTYNLLNAEQRAKADRGYYKERIIAYQYPNDPISNFLNKSIGAIYYMDYPHRKGLLSGFGDHGASNYTNWSMFDENGYYRSEYLFDETLYANPTYSPLEMKNKGVHNFYIVIKTEILKGLSEKVDGYAEMIRSSEQAMEGFYDYYFDTMAAMKRKYIRKIGYAEFELLHMEDVEEIMNEFGSQVNGYPMTFDMDVYIELLDQMNKVGEDTAEIAFAMKKISEDFTNVDQLTASLFEPTT